MGVKTKMDVSIIFATYKRNDLLALMLESFTKLNMDGITYEIVAADNCPEQTAKTLVEEFASRLPITYCPESLPGKNAALTSGLKIATGDLTVFTDDDIDPDPNWIQSFIAAAQRHPQASIFGGRILPKYPAGHEKLGKGIDFTHSFVRTAFSEADWPQPEGPIDAGRIWGANMMVRREVFNSGLSFNPNIGPQGKNYAMGSETEFLLRAYAQGLQGVYVPGALIHHHILPNQLSVEWIVGRAFRLARGRAQMDPQLHCTLWWGVPRYLYKNYVLKRTQVLFGFVYSEKEHFRHVLEFAKIRGQITQYRIMAKNSRTKREAS